MIDASASRAAQHRVKEPIVMEVALEEPLGDVQETLDAAFALIDACIPSPSSSSSSGRSSTWELPVGRAELACVSTPEVHLPESKKTQVACASNSTVQLSKPGKKPLTHQYRQREEIARLRGEVVLLENQLNLMRVMTKKQLGAENASVGGIRERHISWDLENFVKVKRGEHSIGAVSLWRDVAARQKKLRSTSESERNHLRFMLSEQRKTIRSIKRLIIRETERQLSPKQDFNPGPQLIGLDSVVMDQLYEELHEIYKGVDDAFYRCGLSSMTTTPIEHRYFQLSATKYSALIMESRIMPFNYKQAASAMWELTLGVCSDREGDFGSKSSAVVGDTVFRSYAIETPKNGCDFSTTGEHAMRKYVENTRVVFVNNGRGQPQSVDGFEAHDIVCREVGRVVAAPLPSQLQGDDGILCCLRSCMEITADIAPTSQGSRSHALEFLRSLVAHKVSTFDEFSGTLEGILLRRAAPSVGM